MSNENTVSQEELEEFTNWKNGKAKRAAYNERRRIKNELIVAKALAKGISVTDEELNAELKKRKDA